MTVFRSILFFGPLAVASWAHSLLAQNDSSRIQIRGVVLDPLRQPIQGAEVRVIGTDLTTSTTPEGTFGLLIPRATEYLIQVRRPGYNAILLRFTGPWNGTVLLEPGTYKLPDIQVTARYAKPAEYAGTNKYDDYFRRRRMGIGEFVSREEIERKNPLHATEILEGRSGIKVTQTSINGTLVAFARCNEYPPKINVYVDGHKLTPERNDLVMVSAAAPWGYSTKRDPTVVGIVGEMLSRVNPSDIELVEIFRGPGELPGEFNDGNCGAISIWTRQGKR